MWVTGPKSLSHHCCLSGCPATGSWTGRGTETPTRDSNVGDRCPWYKMLHPMPTPKACLLTSKGALCLRNPQTFQFLCWHQGPRAWLLSAHSFQLQEAPLARPAELCVNVSGLDLNIWLGTKNTLVSFELCAFRKTRHTTGEKEERTTPGKTQQAGPG